MHIRSVLSLLVIVVVLVALPRPASAQNEPSTSIMGGYTHLREQGPGGLDPVTYESGWVISVAQRIGRSRWSGVGEIGANYRTNVFDEKQTLLAYLGGARYVLTRSSRVSTFAQALAGVERFSEPGFSQSGFAFQPGAGVDIAVAKALILRLQGDYRVSRQDELTFKEFRLAVSAGISIGR